MKHHISMSQWLFSAVGMLSLATMSRADVITFSATTPTAQFGPWLSGGAFNEAVTLPRFNPANGLLNGIALTLDAVGSTSGWGVDVYNPFTFATDAYADVMGNFYLCRPDGSQLVFMGHYTSFTTSVLLAPKTTASIFLPVPDNTASVLLADPADLSLFTGADSITLSVRGFGYPYVYPDTLGIASATPQTGFGQVTITYDFAPVPEPSSFALLTVAIPSGALLFQRRIGKPYRGNICRPTGED